MLQVFLELKKWINLLPYREICEIKKYKMKLQSFLDEKTMCYFQFVYFFYQLLRFHNPNFDKSLRGDVDHKFAADYKYWKRVPEICRNR